MEVEEGAPPSVIGIVYKRRAEKCVVKGSIQRRITFPAVIAEERATFSRFGKSRQDGQDEVCRAWERSFHPMRSGDWDRWGHSMQRPEAFRCSWPTQPLCISCASLDAKHFEPSAPRILPFLPLLFSIHHQIHVNDCLLLNESMNSCMNHPS